MSGSTLVQAFDEAARRPAKVRRKVPPPVSIRFKEAERARLVRDAGTLSLSGYIRRKLFDDDVSARKPRYLRKQRRPGLDHETLARLLGVLGQSELATSMIALALAAQSGALPVTPDLSEKLDTACADIRAMRTELIVALKIKPEDGQ